MPKMNLPDLGEYDVPESLVPLMNARGGDENVMEWGIWVNPQVVQDVKTVGRFLLKTLGEGEAYEKATDSLASDQLQAMLYPLGEMQEKMNEVLADYAAGLRAHFPAAFEEVPNEQA